MSKILIFFIVVNMHRLVLVCGFLLFGSKFDGHMGAKV